jgi:rhodanese-related sulfurtransferase
VAQVEKSALVPLLARDATAVLIDAREPGARPRLANATSISVRDAATAKDDGRLPMNDHNTRIFVVGDTGTQARAVAEAIVRDAFHNVAFFDGGVNDVPELTTRAP